MRKFCKGCDEEKILSDFYPCKNTRLGVSSRCKPCHQSASYRARRRRIEGKTPLNSLGNLLDPRDASRRRRYGISAGDYENLLLFQGSRCSICWRSATLKALSVDHCHETGAVRGLLCANCNRVLGWFVDNPVRFDRAAEYLRDSKKNAVTPTLSKNIRMKNPIAALNTYE